MRSGRKYAIECKHRWRERGNNQEDAGQEKEEADHEEWRTKRRCVADFEKNMKDRFEMMGKKRNAFPVEQQTEVIGKTNDRPC